MQLPSSLINALQAVKGFDEAAFKQVHESGEQVTSIRLNPLKATQQLTPNNPLEKVPWSTNGYYLPQRPSFTLDPLFHAGAYYVQEASSMFLEQALKQTVDLSQPLKILDLCAAPGGKSTLIQSLISAKSLLVSNEVIRTRVNVLSENITKWGAANVIVTNNDPKDFQRLQNYFDVIVVDAPCSGSGLFRKDPAAIEEWSENNVQLCSQRQQRILTDILPSLKEGGVIIYSTCSYSTEEDETIADWLVAGCHLSPVSFQLKKDWNIIETTSSQHNAYGYRFYPDKLKGEGFFIAAFKKQQTGEVVRSTAKVKSGSEKISAATIEMIRPYLIPTGDYFFFKQNEEIIALPLAFEKELPIIQSALYIKKAGVRLGTMIRNELIPDHELAVSTIINPLVKTIDVDITTALQYLRRVEIKLPETSNGWALLRYGQLPIGWVKILPRRVNNYYPKDWRILNK